jgi:hypothetical protein
MNEMRAGLEPLPGRMLGLPVDKRGYPVPWFVDWLDGEPEFRAMDPEKWAKAIKRKLCWVCGQQLGTRFSFVLGPMCGINRTTAEPPCHLDCARWSARNCPFLTAQMTRRREDDPIVHAVQGSQGRYLDPGWRTWIGGVVRPR